MFHCHLSAPKTPAPNRRKYIERDGTYKYREDKIYSTSCNMPSWAKSPDDFWDTCLQNEKGTQYKEIEFALPNDIPLNQAVNLAKEQAATELSGHAYTLAIHCNNGRLSGIKNLHCHIMYTEREIDPNRPEPDRNTYFRRSRTLKNGTISGGYKKSEKMTKGANRHKWYQDFRAHLAAKINNAYQQNNINKTVDHRSYKEQGIDKLPQRHVGSRSARTQDERYQEYLKVKQLNTDYAAAQKELEAAQNEEEIARQEVMAHRHYIKNPRQPSKTHNRGR